MAGRKRSAPAQDVGEAPGYLLYARVSTKRQDDKPPSIPDQCAQMHVHVAALNGLVRGEFREARTATDDRRPQCQEMVERACSGGEGVVAIVVHSFSRFMRDAHMFETYARRLAAHGVRIISITQPTGEEESPLARLARGVMTLFDEYSSLERASTSCAP